MWNGEPRFELADEGGRTVVLQITPELTRRCGGVRTFYRKHVTVTGIAVEAERETLRVLGIDADDRSVPSCR